jgi:uncharacterized membrane protein
MAKKQDNSKLVAILSYITLIGWIVALILNQQKKTDLGSFHIRQTLMIMLTGIVLAWVPIIGWILSIVLFVFWIIGLVGAINGEKKEIPIIGGLAQDWFKGL